MQLAPAAIISAKPTPPPVTAAPAQASAPRPSARSTVVAPATASRPPIHDRRATGSAKRVSSRPDDSSSRRPPMWLTAKRATISAKSANTVAR